MSGEQKLRAALARLKEGKPVHVSPGKRISLSSIEDEAGVGRSLIRHYPDLHKEALDVIKAQKREPLSSNTRPEKAEDIDKIKKELVEKKAELSKLRKANSALIRTNAELFTLLNAVAHKNRRDIDLESVVGSVTKVNISDNIRSLLK
ncbi:hypothetical protein AB4562_16850 [Vibrio sp. 10N.222.54.A1]|uniref:hypothetical protein n=1 Tax=Vibrio TaxID=662 RepID=UPI000C836162|nr:MULTISPECIES: hypothetical protein [Vibrio]CAH6923201.1 conserved hypothetical protein [Vibrio chagasii]NOI96745.1 hypothetical protein [Vibrio sp. T3Y01]PMK75197.1 hypothetical protein BCT92_06570 [Vibrio sp. 10N.261.52.E5]PQJ48078.1 hypothetical protein BTO12_21720 [Vibrio splendidus]TKF82646.1 hypothetical protein FCV65_13875 [Vibrio sp. F13]